MKIYVAGHEKSIFDSFFSGNPILEDEDYQNTVYAFLDIEFLDYKRVLNQEKLLAREEKTECKRMWKILNNN